MHLVQMLEQREAIAGLGVEVSLVAYDKPSLLNAKMMTHLVVPYEVLLDETKSAYRAWGMGRANIFRSVLSPTLSWRYLKLLMKGERFLGLAPDMYQLGGDFIVDAAGRIAFAHRMRDNGDRASVSQLLAALRQAGPRATSAGQ